MISRRSSARRPTGSSRIDGDLAAGAARPPRRSGPAPSAARRQLAEHRLPRGSPSPAAGGRRRRGRPAARGLGGLRPRPRSTVRPSRAARPRPSGPAGAPAAAPTPRLEVADARRRGGRAGRGRGFGPVSVQARSSSSSQRAARSLAAPSFSPFWSCAGPVGELPEPSFDLAQPRREPGRLERLGAAQRLGRRADLGEPPLVGQEPAHVVDQRQALRAAQVARPTRARPSAGRASPGRTSRRPAAGSAPTAVAAGSSVSRSWTKCVRRPSTASGSHHQQRQPASSRSGRAIAARPSRSQKPRRRRRSGPRTTAAGSRASRTSRAGVRVSVATRVSASPSATLGPVLEKSLNLVVPISERPTITVPALVSSGRDRPLQRQPASRRPGCAGSSARRTATRGTGRSRSRVPNRIATRNSSTSGEISQPARVIQASTPRAIDQADADRHQRHQRQPERAIDRPAGRSAAGRPSPAPRGRARSGRSAM